MEDEDAAYFQRQGFWLRMARERAGKSQAGAAEHINLARSSKGTISDYENAVQHASQDTLRSLARWYGVPLSLFLDPPMTTDQVIEMRIVAASRRGATAERRDWEAEPDQDPATDAEPADEPGTLLALVRPRSPK